jgi:hypothetical protein
MVPSQDAIKYMNENMVTITIYANIDGSQLCNFTGLVSL